MPTRGTACTVRYFAYDVNNKVGKINDAGNHTIRIQLDNNPPVDPTNGFSQIDSGNLPGWYQVILEPEETQCDTLLVGGRSTTAGVIIQGTQITFEGLIAFPSVPSTNAIASAVDNILSDNFTALATQISGLDLTTEQITAAILAMTIETGFTFQDIMKLISAFVGGLTTGGGTDELIFRDLNNTLDRIKFTLSAHNNRVAVTRDMS